MARFFEGNGLFDTDNDRVATTGNAHCDWCGKSYSNREDKDGGGHGDSIEIGHFGSLQVLECCFGKVEAAVLENLPDIIPWFLRILQGRQRYIDRRKTELQALATLIQERTKSA
ncbi:MAG: hypothetical protein ACM3NH_01575 [Candidatus Saccharibacteria bacterium]